MHDCSTRPDDSDAAPCSVIMASYESDFALMFEARGCLSRVKLTNAHNSRYARYLTFLVDNMTHCHNSSIVQNYNIPTTCTCMVDKTESSPIRPMKDGPRSHP